MTKPLTEYTADEINAAVADGYGQVAATPGHKFNFPVGRAFAESVGYDATICDAEVDRDFRVVLAPDRSRDRRPEIAKQSEKTVVTGLSDQREVS